MKAQDLLTVSQAQTFVQAMQITFMPKEPK